MNLVTSTHTYIEDTVSLVLFATTTSRMPKGNGVILHIMVITHNTLLKGTETSGVRFYN